MVLIAKLLTLALTAAATPILRRNAITVEDDINQRIAPGISALGNDVRTFPASGLAGAVAIHDDFQNLVYSVNYATTDTNDAGSLDDETGAAILNDVQAVIGNLLSILTTLADQATSWSNVPGGADLVLSDLRSLHTAFDNSADALITNEPASLSDQTTLVKTYIDNAFASAEDAYSS
ncbi:cell wall mannoprotein 1 family protein [Aspergillus vadensis CBS 113365]|uniref:Hydrophobic surface binding protein A n=1 Tax=Aspergillus vadensis (strain CBS 113365 / IMI 142717 / IBT 24658) TaxID=1448311 RepID=A0A319B0T4_ASPVC|nr:hypothetical protein BO88DRAFT_417949 [Aspergillus vadensis CBS 113365]PYH66246.1 hypothetical protein BO88DRAFT_417949 [Aspergillus vadensis CBS 113365]